MTTPFIAEFAPPMLYKTSLQRHVESLHRALPLFEAEAQMDFTRLWVRVTGRGQQIELRPQFVGLLKGKRAYFQGLSDHVRGFIGWLPYPLKRWPAGTGKQAFKDLCVEKGLATPATWDDPTRPETDYLVKSFSSSFGIGVRGPLRPGQALPSDVPFDKSKWYCEAFVRGRALKAWYWDNRLACVEIQSMPSIEGDGRHSVAELAEAARPKVGPDLDLTAISDLCAYQDLRLDSIPAAGRRILADVRYGSPLSPSRATNSNVLAQERESAIGRQLIHAAPFFWESIPQALRLGVLYTVDAVVDENDRVWFLEMNCNPMGHPDIYMYMLEGFFGPRSRKDAPAARTMPERDMINPAPH